MYYVLFDKKKDYRLLEYWVSAYMWAADGEYKISSRVHANTLKKKLK